MQAIMTVIFILPGESIVSSFNAEKCTHRSTIRSIVSEPCRTLHVTDGSSVQDPAQ